MTFEDTSRETRSPGRPRIVSCRFRRSPSGRCRCQVTFGWSDGHQAQGEAEGICSPSGELRCAAEAALAALTGGGVTPEFELVGVKPLRAFDSTLVIVSLAIRGGSGGPRFVGSVLAEVNPVQAAVRAVLHAVNRVIARDPSEGSRNGNGASGI